MAAVKRPASDSQSAKTASEAPAEPEAPVEAPVPAEDTFKTFETVAVDPPPGYPQPAGRIFDDTPTSVTITQTYQHTINGAFYDLQAGSQHVFPAFVVDELVQLGIGAK